MTPLRAVPPQCLIKCPAPVLLIHKDAFKGISTETKATDRARGEVTDPCKITVCVDDHNIAEKCFDFAVRIARYGDEVTALYVVTNDSLNKLPKISKHYTELASKAMDSRCVRMRSVPPQT